MGKSLRVAYGEALVKLGQKNDKIVALDADLAHATMSATFAEAFPDRFFNAGIAECNMMGMAAGFAHTGYIPFASTFALFGTGRAYEIIRNSIAYTNTNVKFGLSHSGLSVGEDGGSHQSIEDVALMREMPNMTIFVPCDPTEMEKAVFAAAEIDGPVYIRVARPVCEDITTEDTPFIPGKANILKDGNDVCIITMGLMVPIALKAAEMLEAEGISAAVVNMHTVKPIDAETILAMNEKCKGIVTAEEHSVIGGLGSAVAEVLAGHAGAKFERVGIQDKFGKSGKPAELFAAYGLTAENIVEKCKATFDGEGMQRVFENEKWTVGIKNWKPANDITGINNLERHNKTDELFVLVAGSCTLIYANEVEGGLDIKAVKMEPNKVYNIPATLWHNTVTCKDTKMILIEDSNTSMDNSDILDLNEDQIAAIKALV